MAAVLLLLLLLLFLEAGAPLHCVMGLPPLLSFACSCSPEDGLACVVLPPDIVLLVSQLEKLSAFERKVPGQLWLRGRRQKRAAEVARALVAGVRLREPLLL